MFSVVGIIRETTNGWQPQAVARPCAVVIMPAPKGTHNEKRQGDNTAIMPL